MLIRPSRPRRGGTVTPWLVLSLTAIIGIVALGIDGGRMMEERRATQAAADAAALAAACQVYENYSSLAGQDNGTATAAANASAATNGYGADGSSTVTVNIPPQSGSFAGQAGYAEVIVERQLAASFGAIFTGKPLTIQARSVAQGTPYKIGMIILNRTANGALTTTGGSAVTLLNTSIIVNSSSSTALNNGGLLMLASSFELSGGYTSSGLMLGPVHTGVAPAPDPLWSLPPPDPANYRVQSTSQLQINAGLPVILQPGIYRGGIALQGGGSAIMNPGVYILDGGGLTLSGPSALVANQVMLYNTSLTQQAGKIDLSGSGTALLTPPTSGPYQGISIFQDRALTNPLTFSGGSVLAVEGTVYAPKAGVVLSGSVTASVLFGGFISDTMTLSGSASIKLQLGNNPPRAPNITLVE
jgi:hypothetical protein